MAHWDPIKVECGNCNSKPMFDMTTPADNMDERILWCRGCGTILTANIYDPISWSDWYVPKLGEMNWVPKNAYSGRMP